MASRKVPKYCEECNRCNCEHCKDENGNWIFITVVGRLGLKAYKQQIRKIR